MIVLLLKATESEESVIDVFTRSVDLLADGEDLPPNYAVVDPVNNLRIDLMAADFIDQVELLLSKNNYDELLEDLKITLESVH